MHKIISDVEELKYFFDNILPPLKSTEVYFVSLSARNKYLSEKEREQYCLGRTEMFAKNIVRKREWSRFLRTLRKYEVNEGGYTTKNDSNIPSKCITCYININPSDTLLALKAFKTVLEEYQFELANIAINKRDPENIANRVNKLDNNLMTAYQQAHGTRHWIDIDMDVPKDFDPLEKTSYFLRSKGVNTFYLLDTKSGYHLLIKKEELTFNPSEIIEEVRNQLYSFFYGKLHSDAKAVELTDASEIIVNKNQMIPVPGTLQGGYPVRVINKGV